MRSVYMFFVVFSVSLVAPAYSAENCSHSEYHGTISKYPINMTIDISCDGDITGNYSYQKYKKPIAIQGKLPANHSNRDKIELYAEKESFILNSINFNCEAGDLDGTWKNEESTELPIQIALDKYVKTENLQDNLKLKTTIAPSGVVQSDLKESLTINDIDLDLSFSCESESLERWEVSKILINQIPIIIVEWQLGSMAMGEVDEGSLKYIHPNGKSISSGRHTSKSGLYDYENYDCIISNNDLQLIRKCQTRSSTQENLPSDQMQESEEQSEEFFNVDSSGFTLQSTTKKIRSLTHPIDSQDEKYILENQPWLPNNN